MNNDLEGHMTYHINIYVIGKGVGTSGERE